jgi:hypothetical protein
MDETTTCVEYNTMTHSLESSKIKIVDMTKNAQSKAFVVVCFTTLCCSTTAILSEGKTALFSVIAKGQVRYLSCD